MAHYREWLPKDGPVDVEFIAEDDGKGNHHALRHRQDCTPIAEHAKRLAQHEQHGTPEMGAKLAAVTPVLFLYKTWPLEFQQRYGVHPHHPDLRNVPRDQHTSTRREVQRMWDRFRREKMNDREFSDFRVDKGRV